MPEIADRIFIDYENQTFEVDGKPFPWHITNDGPTVETVLEHPQAIGVTVTLIAIASDVEVRPKQTVKVAQ